jgi:hypothetical protein
VLAVVTTGGVAPGLIGRSYRSRRAFALICIFSRRFITPFRCLRESRSLVAVVVLGLVLMLIARLVLRSPFFQIARESDQLGSGPEASAGQ